MCSVVGCESWCRSAQRFKLPEDPERRLEWVQFLFEVNGQRLKESNWTDITICSEHFTEDCFETLTPWTGAVQLKPGVAPSLCLKSEPDDPAPYQEPVGTTEVASQCDQLNTHDSPSSCSDQSGAAPESSVPSDTSDTFMSDYSQMLQKIVNIDMIREKAALLQKKGKYVVNENRLLQLFSRKCPLCGSKLKVEKVTYGVLIILNQQCLQCEYRYQWKSQVNASVPTAEDQHLKGGIEVETKETLSTDDNHSTVTGASEIVDVINDESDPMDDTEESGDEGDTDSDEDWNPVEQPLLDNKRCNDETDDESENENDDDPSIAPTHSQLCTECGMFFRKRWPHTCEHKSKPYSCNICGKRCVSEVALLSHSRIHNVNYEHRCKYCHVTFKTKVDKISHEQTHITEGRPYKCPDCSETFATNKDRSIHLEDHRGPPQLKCHICGIEFNRSRSLQRHLAVHTGLKPYKCSVCQRGFNQPSHLKSHIRVHTGERPYKCQHCDRSFNHNVSLKSHIQRYHSSNSGLERKRVRKNRTVSSTFAQENRNKRDTDSGTDNVEHDKEEEVRKERTNIPKSKRRSTGRPIGRPKRNAAGNLVLDGEMQGQCSNTETAKVAVRKSKRTRHSDEDSEDELTESDISFDSAEEEEDRTEKVTSSMSRSSARTKNSDSDSDFDQQDSKKKRYSRRNSGVGSRKRRGRPRKNEIVEDT